MSNCVGGSRPIAHFQREVFLERRPRYRVTFTVHVFGERGHDPDRMHVRIVESNGQIEQIPALLPLRTSVT
jgi:hypothetical protein